MFSKLQILIAVLGVFTVAAIGQTPIPLKPNVPIKFTIEGKQPHEYMIDLKSDDVGNITINAVDLPVSMEIRRPTGETLVSDREASVGYVFVADMPGTYVLKFYLYSEMPEEELAKHIGKQVTVKYSNRFVLPASAKTKAAKAINGYQVKIADEPAENGKTFLLIQKAGKLKALMAAEKEISGGYYFSDDPEQLEGANAKRSAALMRTTVDKTGDGTPDVAVEYYTGGAHCCFEMTFFELGEQVRQLPTIDSANDRMTAVAKRPQGGLRFQFAEQAFAYWNINFAQSPMPIVIYEFDKSDELVPRFDLMRKPAPTQAELKRRVAEAKAKINLNPYKNPDDNFNDWEDSFWGEMLDLIYTGHEDLAWQYLDLVWPAKKQGKAKFLADFKEQLDHTAYGDWKEKQAKK